MHLIATTDEAALHVDRERLERTGIEPAAACRIRRLRAVLPRAAAPH
jgi:hypothetical protein